MAYVYLDQPGVTFDGGFRYDDSPQPPIPGQTNPTKTMKASVALNTRGLKPPQQLARLQKAITKLTSNLDMTSPNPTLVSAQAKHDLAVTKLAAIDVKDAELKALRLDAAAAVDDAMYDYGQLGKFVDNKASGDAVKIAAAGFDVAATDR